MTTSDAVRSSAVGPWAAPTIRSSIASAWSRRIPTPAIAGMIAGPSGHEPDRADRAEGRDGGDDQALDRDAPVGVRAVDLGEQLERAEDRRGEDEQRDDPDERAADDRRHADDRRDGDLEVAAPAGGVTGLAARRSRIGTCRDPRPRPLGASDGTDDDGVDIGADGTPSAAGRSDPVRLGRRPGQEVGARSGVDDVRGGHPRAPRLADPPPARSRARGCGGRPSRSSGRSRPRPPGGPARRRGPGGGASRSSRGPCRSAPPPS